jgi:hypothetical protein
MSFVWVWRSPIPALKQLSDVSGADKPGGDDGVDNAFAQQHANAGIGAEIMGAGKFGYPGWHADPEWTGWWGPSRRFTRRCSSSRMTRAHRSKWRAAPRSTLSMPRPAEALEQARKTAGGQDVRIGGGVTMLRDFLAAGLVDHMHIVVVPILLGRCVRLWDGLEGLEKDYQVRGHLLAERSHAYDVHPCGWLISHKTGIAPRTRARPRLSPISREFFAAASPRNHGLHRGLQATGD